MHFDFRQVWADVVLMYFDPLLDAIQEFRQQIAAS
jgi:hypothetical protein